MKPRVFFVLVFIIGLAGCGNTDSKAKLPLGYLDAPKPEETIRGRYQVAGWALAESGIKDVSIYLDRGFIAQAAIGQNRPDLQRPPFSAFPNAGSSGFVYQWDTRAVTPGSHELLVQARTNDGATRDLGIASVTVAH
jgi:hypothetical protein